MGVIFPHMAGKGEIEPEVSVEPAGFTADRKPVFKVKQLYKVPPEVHAKEKQGLQHGERLATRDEFYIVRPATG